MRDCAYIALPRLYNEGICVERLETLAEMLNEFALICFGLHPIEERTGTAVRVRDIYRFRKRGILRIGRYAELPWYEEEEEDGAES